MIVTLLYKYSGIMPIEVSNDKCNVNKGQSCSDIS